MKKICFITLFSLISIFSFAMSKKANFIQIEGSLNMYGNEPFSYLGLRSSDEKVYKIETDSDTFRELSVVQGNKIIVSGELIIPKNNKKSFNGLKDGTIILESWSVVE